MWQWFLSTGAEYTPSTRRYLYIYIPSRGCQHHRWSGGQDGWSAAKV